MFEDARQARAEMLARLLPPGPAWDGGSTGNELFPSLLRVLAGDGARVQLDLEQLVADFFPDTSTAFLDDWERVLALKKGSLTQAERRVQILAKLRGYGDPSLPSIEGIAVTFAPDAFITNRPYLQFRVGVSTMGDGLYGDAFTSVFRVTYTGPRNTQLEDAVNAAKPLHTFAEFVTV